VRALESVLHDDGVLQAAIGAELFADDLLEQSDVVLFQPFIEELRGYLDRQDAVRELHGLDRLEPGLEALRVHIVPDHRQATFPGLLGILLHGSVFVGWGVDED
jgi:hypothetical protein